MFEPEKEKLKLIVTWTNSKVIEMDFKMNQWVGSLSYARDFWQMRNIISCMIVNISRRNAHEKWSSKERREKKTRQRLLFEKSLWAQLSNLTGTCTLILRINIPFFFIAWRLLLCKVTFFHCVTVSTPQEIKKLFNFWIFLFYYFAVLFLEIWRFNYS